MSPVLIFFHILPMLKWLQPGLWMFVARLDEIKLFETNLYSLQQGQLSSFSLFSIQTHELEKTCSCDSMRGIAICFKTGWNLPIWYFHLHLGVLCTMGTCRVISGWWAALPLGQFYHLCLFFLDVFPSELVASTSSLSCLLTQSLNRWLRSWTKMPQLHQHRPTTKAKPSPPDIWWSRAPGPLTPPWLWTISPNPHHSSHLSVEWKRYIQKSGRVNQKSETQLCLQQASNCQESINQPQPPIAFW